MRLTISRRASSRSMLMIRAGEQNRTVGSAASPVAPAADAGLHAAVQQATCHRRGQRVAQHHQRLLVRAETDECFAG
jgi:hypothetical protein